MSLAILSRNPRRPDEPMMTLIAGATERRDDSGSVRGFGVGKNVRPARGSAIKLMVVPPPKTLATKSQMTPQATAGCAKRGRGASSVNRMGISRV
jgi:hypothetical protein